MNKPLGCTSKTVSISVVMIFSLVVVWGTRSLCLSKHFRYNLYANNNCKVITLSYILIVTSTFFFFLCWRYNPLCVSAFSVIFFHSVLSLLIFLHHLIPILWIPSSTFSIHLFLGRPLILLPIGFHSNILLGSSPSIHPHHVS